MSGMDKLQTLLFSAERELVNIKFFPGTDRGLTVDHLCEASHAALESALARGPVDNPPTSGRIKATIQEFLS